jgi:hypothetical protein
MFEQSIRFERVDWLVVYRPDGSDHFRMQPGFGDELREENEQGDRSGEHAAALQQGNARTA